MGVWVKIKELAGIQYLRGIAALAVVIDHAAGMTAFPKYFGAEVAGGLLVFGAIGVDIFFVISGFIITIVALSPSDLSATQTPSTFFLKRFVRIVPLMWVAIISYFLLRTIAGGDTAGAMSYVRAFFLVPYGDVDPNQIWTLRHEAIFYTVFALSFLPARQMRFVLYAWVASPLFIHAYQKATGFAVPDQSVAGIVFSPYNLEFAAGFFVGLLRLKGLGRETLAWSGKPHPAITLTLLSLAVIIFGAISKAYLSKLMTTLILAVIAGLLIYLASRLPRKEGAMDKLCLLLGNASYSVYLFHPHVESAMLRVLTKVTPWMEPALVVIVVTVGATIAGIMVHLFLEKPLVRICQHRLLKRVPAPLHAPAPTTSLPAAAATVTVPDPLT
jgi:exopolysaccharide production protein ExoZ